MVVSSQVVCISRTAYYYKPKISDDSEIIDVLNELTDKHNRWEFPKCFKHIRKLAYSWNNKRVHRVYNALNLNLCCETRNSKPLSVPSALGQTWFMYFMSDRLHNNIRFRTFNVIDDCNRDVLGIDIGTSITSLRMILYID